MRLSFVLLVNEFIPRAIQGAMDTDEGCEKNVDLAGFDLLHGAYIQIRQFSKPFLSHFTGNAFPAHISAKPFKLRLNYSIFWHAPLRRKMALT